MVAKVANELSSTAKSKVDLCNAVGGLHTFRTLESWTLEHFLKNSLNRRVLLSFWDLRKMMVWIWTKIFRIPQVLEFGLKGLKVRSTRDHFKFLVVNYLVRRRGTMFFYAVITLINSYNDLRNYLPSSNNFN